jgi:serine/threonine protein phosphatase 1
VRPVFLAGNHEEFLLRALNGEDGVMDQWLRYGGDACARSYGIDPELLFVLPQDEAAALLRKSMPERHQRFLESMGDTFRFGDYLIVHAGIRPGVRLEEQRRADLRWIRQPFLDDTGDHGVVVVHGHTIVEDVEERPNRIGIDTGAYRTGRLTALILEGNERRTLASDRLELAAAA